MNALYLGSRKLLLQTEYGGKLIIPSDDLSVTPELALTGGMERPLTRFFIHNVKPGHRVIDIGANVGYFSVLLGYLVGTEGQVWSYEPHPRLYSFLKDNLSINYLHDRVALEPKAVYSANRQLVFQAAQRFLGNSSIHPHNEAYFRHYHDETVEVTVDTAVLDEQLHRFQQIDYIKIDIEGGEYHAFLGMEKLIADHARHIIFELNPAMLQHDYAPFCELLQKYESKLGKRFYLIAADGTLQPVPLDRLLGGSSLPYVLMKNE